MSEAKENTDVLDTKDGDGKETEPSKTGVRDLDFRSDFNNKGELVNPELKEHFDAERAALLGTPVGSEGQGYVDEPVIVERAAPDEKAEIRDGDTADILVARYSKSQITALADENKVEYGAKEGKLSIAINILKKHAAENPSETSLTVPPAATDAAESQDGEKKG